MAVADLFERMTRAFICPPGKNIAAAAAIGVPDAARAAVQHRKYAGALQHCGVDVVTVSPAFSPTGLIGSAAVVTDRLAVIGNFAGDHPQLKARQAVASALAGDNIIKFIAAPGLLDAGDVLRLRNHFYISLSDRTNEEGAAQLAFFLTDFGYAVTLLERQPDKTLRLGASAVHLGQNKLLIREELARQFAFLSFDKIIVPRAARGAAAGLMVNDTLLLPAGYADIGKAVREAGISVIEVNISEFEKIGGSLGDLSLRLPKTAAQSNIVLPNIILPREKKSSAAGR